VLVDPDYSHPVEPGRVVDQSPLALGQDRVVGGVPRHPQRVGDPSNRQVPDHDRLQRPPQPAPGQLRPRRSGPAGVLAPHVPAPAAPVAADKDSRGFDAGKKVNGRKRHIAVDTLGLLVCVLVTAASVQDRTAARDLLTRLRGVCPTIRHLWADSGYTGTLLAWARSLFDLTIEIVAKLAGQTTFVVLPRRWVVERSLAWITGHRRCVRDYERLPQHHEAMVRWTMIRITSRRLTK
jgi:transposase